MGAEAGKQPARSPRTRSTILRQFVQNPREVGSLHPSSRSLGDAVAAAVRWPEGGLVVEAGPGDGAITERLLAAKPAGVRLLAVELNPDCASALRARIPDVEVVVDDLANLVEICERKGLDRPAAIVATLPWSVLPRERQRVLAEAILSALAPGGQLLFYIYVQAIPFWRRSPFARILASRFSVMDRGAILWKNLPPAVVLDCRGLRPE